MKYFTKNDEILAFDDEQLHLVTDDMTEIDADELSNRLAPSKSELQAQVWEAIKAKRHAVTRGGVFIGSVGKWFHTDDSSRTQYLTLQIMPSLPPGLMWKTMDNTFIKVTKALLDEIAMTILTEEQVNFTNAENHRVEMLKADDPLSYDYSTGWSKTYE